MSCDNFVIMFVYLHILTVCGWYLDHNSYQIVYVPSCPLLTALLHNVCTSPPDLCKLEDGGKHFYEIWTPTTKTIIFSNRRNSFCGMSHTGIITAGDSPTHTKRLLLPLAWHLVSQHSHCVQQTSTYTVQAAPALSSPPSALLLCQAKDGFGCGCWVGLKLKLHSRNILGNSTE